MKILQMETQHNLSLQDEDSNLFPEDPFSDIPESSDVQNMTSTPMALSNTFSQVFTLRIFRSGTSCLYTHQIFLAVMPNTLPRVPKLGLYQ